ncbi:hypothetical protein EWM64_g6642 [Hericium alpestre]|uniref:Transcription factor domain-containing protein n=1 Tax=Hericium alpestre TaxID=135208 RepID=A0A4Y9ZV26_9AGAM|nr:hypothetical protein EWM64_g6642 [Hericium alpestre]
MRGSSSSPSNLRPSSSAQSAIRSPSATSGGNEELPAHISQQLLDHFFGHASQFGWFLHVVRFRHATLLPARNANRPPPALLNAVYLCGAMIMRQVTGTNPYVNECIFLSLALSDDRTLPLRRPVATSHPEHSSTNIAVSSLSLTSGLHRIRSAQFVGTPSSFVDSISLTLDAPKDQIEEGERINGLWAMFTLDRTWAIAFSVPSIISDSDTFETQIDTPWPLDMTTYEQGPIYPNFRTSFTLHNFMAGINTGWPWESQSVLAQLSKASALFQQASLLGLQWRPEAQTANTYYADFVAIDQRIEEFKEQLYSLENLPQVSSDVVRTMHTIHCLTHAATIQLHAAFSQRNAASRNRCFASAKAIMEANAAVQVHNFLIINPILGVLWAAASRVFIREIASMRNAPLEQGPTPEREAEARMGLDQLQAVMAVYAPVCGLVNHLFVRLQQERVGL